MKEEKIVLVRYLDGAAKHYAYLVPDYMTVSKGDMVVVQARDTHALAHVVQTTDIAEDQSKWANKYIVQVVDLESFNDYRDGDYYAHEEG
jgi:hypothetical protein